MSNELKKNDKVIIQDPAWSSTSMEGKIIGIKKEKSNKIVWYEVQIPSGITIYQSEKTVRLDKQWGLREKLKFI